jgi:signal peptidase I
MRRSVRRGGFGLVAVLLLLAGLAVLSARTGGPISWHITTGGSMQPAIQPGTLVVVARHASYDIGDLVAYPSRELGQVVLHRVVGIEDGRLLLQGDQNSWVDPERPLPAEALGSRLFQLPGVGGLLGWLGRPGPMGAAVALIALPFLGVQRRHPIGRGGSRVGGLPVAGQPWTLPRLPRVPANAETAVAWVAGLLAVLAAAATVGPLVHADAAGRAGAHVVAWSYGAQVAPGVVYPDGLVQTGDTLYTRLVPAAQIAAQLTIDVEEGTSLAGTWALDVAIEDDSGWRRTTHTGSPVAVDGPVERLTVPLPVSELLALSRRAAEERGVESTGRRISVQARLELTLESSGTVVAAQATPALVFAADDDKLRLVPDSALEHRAAIALPDRVTAQTVQLAGTSLPATPVRIAAGSGALLALLVLALVRIGRATETEDERISRTAGHLLVPMHDLDEPASTVDVTSFDALTALAAHYERKVLFGDHDGLRVYLVLDDGVAYRYYSRPAVASIEAAKAHGAAPRQVAEDRAAAEIGVLIPHQARPERIGT